MIFTLPSDPIPPIGGFEDLAAGQHYRLGSVSLDRADIVEFAQNYDPQPFHLDEAAAEKSVFGQLVASGMQTISAIVGLSVRGGLLSRCNLAGSGMTDVKWLRSVRPDDVLSLDWTIVSVTPSARRPDRAAVHIRYDVTNQDGQPTLSLMLHHIVARGRT